MPRMRNDYCVTLPESIVEKVDKLAKQFGTTRSGAISRILASLIDDLADPKTPETKAVYVYRIKESLRY